MAIITTADVAPWVQATAEELDADPLAPKVIEAVSNLVNETVFEQDEALYWDIADPDRKAPKTAKDVAEQVFARIYINPGGLQAETTGPLTDRRAEFMLTGLELRPGEIERLLKLRADAQNTGLWLLSLGIDDGPGRDEDVVDYVDAYGEMTVPGKTYFPSDYDHA